MPKNYSVRILVSDIVGFGFYFAFGENLGKARSQFKKLSGKFPSKTARIIAFKGTVAALNKLVVQEDWMCRYPKGVIAIKVQ